MQANGRPQRRLGVDLGAELYEHVISPGHATVSYVGTEPRGYGRYIILDHGRGVTTRYAHLSGASIRTGDRVLPAQVIGDVGRTGNVRQGARTHLHFEVRVDGKPIDPQRLYHFWSQR